MKFDKHGVAILYSTSIKIDRETRRALRRFNNLPTHSFIVTNSTRLNTS